jgi:hypothetical protein
MPIAFSALLLMAVEKLKEPSSPKRPEGIAREINAGVLGDPPAVRVSARHGLRLVGMQFKFKRPVS